MIKKTGLLLLNLGTPDSPDTVSVRRYLRQFLTDPRVIDVPALLRYLIVYLAILPFRPARSAHAYQQIWTPQGSPLLVFSENLRRKVESLLTSTDPSVQVRLAMRYGNPSVRLAMEAFSREGIREVVVLPLFPQYAAASSGSAMSHVYEEAARLWDPPVLTVLPPFFSSPDYIRMVAARGRVTLEAAPWDHVIFSFHGIPLRQLKKSESPGICHQTESCCTSTDRSWCYRAACVQTALALAKDLSLEPSQFSVGFQSRLGRTEWIRPYLDDLLTDLPARGIRHVVVFSPAFTADCLETLEELSIRAEATWKEKGGETLRLVPALNDGDDFAGWIANRFRMVNTPS
ncbi:MAG: ferrochelatase [Bacteroidetes bacterium]|nr:ferrochelatase [Bacteroidota bacterium]